MDQRDYQRIIEARTLAEWSHFEQLLIKNPRSAQRFTLSPKDEKFLNDFRITWNWGR